MQNTPDKPQTTTNAERSLWQTMTWLAFLTIIYDIYTITLAAYDSEVITPKLSSWFEWIDLQPVTLFYMVMDIKFKPFYFCFCKLHWSKLTCNSITNIWRLCKATTNLQPCIVIFMHLNHFIVVAKHPVTQKWEIFFLSRNIFLCF